MEEDKPVSVKDMIKQFSRCTTLSSQPVLTPNIDHQTPQRLETTTLSSQSSLTSNNEHQTPRLLETRQLTTYNQPQIPQRSKMTQAQVHVPTFGSTSTENASNKPLHVNKITKKPPISKKPTWKRPTVKAQESIEKKTEEQKMGATYISKPTSSTAINKAGQQVPEARSHIDSDQIKKIPYSLSDCFTKESGTLITEFVTVKVVDVLPLNNYKKRKTGETGKMFIAAICDTTYACLAKVYDSEKVTILQPNTVLILKDFFIGEGEISITDKTKVGSTGDLPKIPDDIIDKASSLLSGTKSKGLLRGIVALQVYKCCTKGECTNRKLEKNECPTCGQSYTEASSGNGFFGELLVETDSEANTLKIYTQQVEDLCTLLGCTSKSTSLKSDIAKKLPVSINFRKNGDKITKISI